MKPRSAPRARCRNTDYAVVMPARPRITQALPHCGTHLAKPHDTPLPLGFVARILHCGNSLMGALYEPCEIGKVLMELGATSRTQRIPSYRPAVAEGLLDCNIATIFQLAQMRPKVAVRFGENLLETAE